MITVDVAKANPTVTPPTDITATYGETLADVELPERFAWKDSTTSVGNTGEKDFIAVYTPEDELNYNTAEVVITVDVAKANPMITLPAGIIVTVGDKLSSVKLPDGFSWDEQYDENTLVGKVGINTFKAMFTPVDKDNYNTVSVNITITVKQNLPTITIQIPSRTTVTYGESLVLTVDTTDMPVGAYVKWTSSNDNVTLEQNADGSTCEVIAIESGDVTVTATVVDKDGNPIKDDGGNDIASSQEITSSAGFWQKTAYLFKIIFKFFLITIKAFFFSL